MQIPSEVSLNCWSPGEQQGAMILPLNYAGWHKGEKARDGHYCGFVINRHDTLGLPRKQNTVKPVDTSSQTAGLKELPFGMSQPPPPNLLASTFLSGKWYQAASHSENSF